MVILKKTIAILIILSSLTFIVWMMILDPTLLIGIPISVVVVGLTRLCVKWLQA